MSAVAEWYSGRSVLVTGARGLMGKTLVEKVLRACPDVERIFLLVRAKRGKTGLQRVNEMWNLPLFSRLRSDRPSAQFQMVAVEGNVEIPGLGIIEVDRQLLLSTVSVVFHFAASLRLEAPLDAALSANTAGTDHVLQFCSQMTNLKAFIHLSTAFCYPNLKYLPESVPPPTTDPKAVLQTLDWLQPNLHKLSADILGPHPNAYTYSKNLGEALVLAQFDKMPVAIVRPSIVTPAYEEPVPGWVDNLNGPTGLMIAAGKGVVRSMMCDGSLKAEVIPLDLAVNALIVISHQVGTVETKPPEIPVYNLSSGETRNITWSEVLIKSKEVLRKYPLEMPLWYPDGDIRTNRFTHELIVFFCHIIPAYFIDFLMILFFQKTFLVHVQKRISVGLEVLQYFTTREWNFATNNFLRLPDLLSPIDRKLFPMDLKIIDIDDYLERSMMGGRTYCLNEPISGLRKARIHTNILYVLDRGLKLLFLYWLSTYIWYWCKMTGSWFTRINDPEDITNKTYLS